MSYARRASSRRRRARPAVGPRPPVFPLGVVPETVGSPRRDQARQRRPSGVSRHSCRYHRLALLMRDDRASVVSKALDRSLRGCILGCPCGGGAEKTCERDRTSWRARRRRGVALAYLLAGQLIVIPGAVVGPRSSRATEPAGAGRRLIGFDRVGAVDRSGNVRCADDAACIVPNATVIWLAPGVFALAVGVVIGVVARSRGHP